MSQKLPDYLSRGGRIRTLRTSRNLSQKDLSDLAEVALRSLSQWENDTKIPDLAEMERIAGALEVELDQIRTRGDRIAALRRSRGLAQSDLANICNTTRATISNWENDKTVPKRGQMDILADAFKVDVSWVDHGRGQAPNLSVPTDEGRRRLMSFESAIAFAGRWSEDPIHRRALGTVPELLAGLSNDGPLKTDGKKTADPWRFPPRVIVEGARSHAENLIVVRVMDEARDLGIGRGDYLLVDITKTEPATGTMVIVEDEGVTTIKRVKIGAKILAASIKGRVVGHLRFV